MPLTVRKVETAAPGRYTDGRGLMLVVKPTGARSWVLRYQMRGRRRDMGLGSYPEVTLAAAREKALQARRHLVDGVDPLSIRPAPALTFRDAAEALIASKRSGWRNPKHAAQWPSTLATYAYPVLGSMDVKLIDTAHVMSVLTPIWTGKSETASRVRQRIEAVLDYASAQGLRSGLNPARWKGHLENLLPKPSNVRRVEHHAALDWRDMPEFMAELALRSGISASALRFLILTAVRSGEVRGMRWAEVDLRSSTWIVAGSRTKSGKEHRVPLTAAALSCLGEPGIGPALVFPSPLDPEKPLSDMSLTAVLRKMGRGDVTAHGFRSSFRDWAGETTPFPREVIEAAMAHRLRDRAEAAYARGDLFDKRRELMTAWAEFTSRL
jgi:integrase